MMRANSVKKAPAPRKKNGLVLIALGLFALAGIYLWYQQVQERLNDETILRRRQQVDTIRSQIEEGDILFRRGKSTASHMILTVETLSRYSHVGVAVLKDHQLCIIHIAPGEGSTPSIAQMESLDDFASAENSALGLFRPQHLTTEQKHMLRHYLLQIVSDRIPFDDRFDSQDQHALYCTELVWQAYLHVGIDLVENRAESLHLPGCQQPVILPSTLLRSDQLESISHVDW